MNLKEIQDKIDDLQARICLRCAEVEELVKERNVLLRERRALWKRKYPNEYPNNSLPRDR